MAGKEKGTNALVKVGDGGGTPATGTTYAITSSGSPAILKVTDSGNGLKTAGAAVGRRVTVSGFTAAENAFNARITAVASNGADLTFSDPVDVTTGLPVTPSAEAAGDTVTLVFEIFTALSGQTNSTYNVQGQSIDTSDKTTGGWGSSLAGTRKLTVQCSGHAEWPDTKGLERVRAAVSSGADLNCILVENSAGDHWYGTFAVTQRQLSTQQNGVTDYALSLENRTAPSYCKGP